MFLPNLTLCFTSDPQVPFVPEDSIQASEYEIPCRVTDPQSVVILRSLPSGDEVLGQYDPRHGFLGTFSPGQYVCEALVNSEEVQSVVYTVPDTPSKPGSTFQLGIRREFGFYLRRVSTCICVQVYQTCLM